jgi:hypothetical protein
LPLLIFKLAVHGNRYIEDRFAFRRFPCFRILGQPAYQGYLIDHLRSTLPSLWNDFILHFFFQACKITNFLNSELKMAQIRQIPLGRFPIFTAK